MAKRPKKPAKLRVGPIIARPIRPPTQRKPDWYWRAEAHVDGETIDVWAGRATAEDLEVELARRLADGSWNAPKDETTGEGTEVVTVGHLLKAWRLAVKRREDLSPASRDAYRGHAKRLEKHLSQVYLDVVGPRVLDGYRDTCIRAGNATSTVSQDLVILRMAWRWGFDRGAVQTPDLPRTQLKVRPKRKKHTPTPAEAAAVLAKAEGYVALVLRILWSTGARVSEAASLQPRDVDLKAGWVTLLSRIVQGRDGKTGARRVPLTPEIRRVLAEVMEGKREDDWLVGVSPHTARQQVIARLPELCDAAKVPRFTSHGFRRLAVDTMARSGVDIKTAAEWMGHSAETMLAHYRAVQDDDLKRAAARAQLGTVPSPDRKVVAFPGVVDPHSRPARNAQDDDEDVT